MRVGIVMSLGLFLLLSGCASGDQGQESGDGDSRTVVRRATANIGPRSGSEVYGTAIFINDPAKGQITLQLDVEGAEPGSHAAHIHETGECGEPGSDGKSAGGHWNPTDQDHGKWEGEHFHLGDIGNVEVGENGEGSLMLTTDRWAMGTGEVNDIMGKAVIIHALADDFTTQPTGAAGARIGCGVIEKR